MSDLPFLRITKRADGRFEVTGDHHCYSEPEVFTDPELALAHIEELVRGSGIPWGGVSISGFAPPDLEEEGPDCDEDRADDGRIERSDD